jgi:spore coat polysaccharide biosynthesis predicted glycosyltransferase SpsG
LIVIDDLNDRYLPADLLINGNITACNLGYIPDKRLLLGPEYVLLREEFRNCPPKKIVERARNLMVTIGGSDQLDLMSLVLNSLSSLDLHIKAVIGPHFKGRERLESMAKRQKSNSFIELVENPDMADLMHWADLAVSAGGSTLYELCATGTPAAVLAIADNQVPAACALDKQGCVWYLGFHDEVLGYGVEAFRDIKKENSPKNLTQAVKTLAQDYFRRSRMSCRGQVLVDGLGTKRCAAVIREISYVSR